MPYNQYFATPSKDHSTLEIVYYSYQLARGNFVYMVVAVKIPSLLHIKFSHYDVDLPVVSLNFRPNLAYPFRVGELLVDS